MKTPSPFTEDEVRDQLLNHIVVMCRYWENESRQPAVRDKLEGLAFSILVALDGEAGALPKFLVAPDPHPDDQEYRVKNG